MRNPISEFHPLAVFLYFITVIGLTMLWNQPVFLSASFLIALGYRAALAKGRGMVKSLVWLLPVILFPVFLNPLINHRGNTPVLYVNDQPVTLEAIAYGLFTGVMIAAMLFWFQGYSASLSSDGFLYLFGKRFPSLSLMVTMVFRFLPQFHRHLQEISGVQKTLGISVQQGSLRRRLKSGSALLSALVSITLEDSIHTADSMISRGYGLPGKTRSQQIRFTFRDGILLGSALTEWLLFFVFWGWGKLNYYYFPSLTILNQQGEWIWFFLVTAVYFLIPIFIAIGEGLRWRFLRRKISRLPILMQQNRL